MNLQSDIFSSREIALGMWLTVVIVLLLVKRSTRSGFGSVLKALFAWKIMVWLLAMAAYISLSIYLFYRIGLWTPDLLKDTIFYVLFSATIAFFNVNKVAKGEKNFFFEMLEDNLKLGIFLEFLTGLYTFDLWIELIIVPFAALLGGMQAVASRNEENAAVTKLINRIWIIAGIAGLYHVGYSVIQHYHDLLSFDNLRQIILAPNLTIILIPFLYILSLCMVYEEQFVQLGFKLRDKGLKGFAKRNAIFSFKTDLDGLKRWVARWNLSRPQTRDEILSTIKAFKAQQALENTSPIVPREAGWSPYLAKDFLPDDALRPAYYDPAFEEQWSARSGNLKLDKDWSGNGIRYSVTGTQLAADKLELRLAAYESKKLEELSAIFRNRAGMLFKTVTGAEPPMKLNDALADMKNLNFRHGIYFILLHKSTWGNITEGYDLIFTISTKHD